MRKTDPMSKSSQIKRLMHHGFGRKHIALVTGVSQSYVRAVYQRMIGGGLSRADQKYVATMPDDVRQRLLTRKRQYSRERGPLYRATGSYSGTSDA